MSMIKIMLDPGHGAGKSHNRGFKTVKGFEEYSNEGDANFIFCNKHLKPALEKVGFTVGMTRNKITDNPTIANRGKMAKGYDILLSSHTNAGAGSGVEVWDSTNPKESIKPLTDLICTTTSKALGIPNRGTKYRKQSNGSNYYGVLRNGLAKHNFIVEWCFHDNQSDVTSYVNNMELLANNVAKAMADYYKLDKVEEVKEEKQFEWSEEAVKWAVDNGISDGLRLQDSCTREEVITMIYRAINGKK